ncbi:MAG: hypothetical protein Q4A44_03520 [Bacteroidales bacterium]|nr:hypothetical protein [Bacteroidales bacterium]
MRAVKLMEWAIVPILAVLILSTLINGATLLYGGTDAIIKFLSFYGKEPLTYVPDYIQITTLAFGFSFVVAAVLLIIALAKREFLAHHATPFLRWGLLATIVGLTCYAFGVRMLANHQAAAQAYFYLVLVYGILWYVERRNVVVNSVRWHAAKLLPIYLMLMITMGLPGFQKIFNAAGSMPMYVAMFEGSILAHLPGGVAPLVYVLGVAELAICVLMLVGLVRGELSPKSPKPFLLWGLGLALITFVMLLFGLSILLNFPGATGLVFYAILTFGLMLYVGQEA